MLVIVFADNHEVTTLIKTGEKAYTAANVVSFIRIALCYSLLGRAPWLNGELVMEAGYSKYLQGLRSDIEGVVYAVLTKPSPPANPSSPPFIT